MGHYRRLRRAFREREGRGLPALAAAGLLVLAMGLPGAARPAAAEAPKGLSPDALLAYGTSDSRGSEMKRGLEELRLAVAARPDHKLSRMQYAVALLRAGRFPEAEREFAAVFGEKRVRALAEGRTTLEQLGSDVDPEVLLGLATSAHLAGSDPREVERLYRAYAELVGPLSSDAARAYQRLHELASGGKADWLDADAELAKAAAVEPGYESMRLLPPLIDPREYPELEPYLRPIELSPASVDTSMEFEALPELALWVAPDDSTQASAALVEGALQLEIHLSADGTPLEVEAVPAPPDEDLAPLRKTVLMWRFTPAVSQGELVPVSILFGEPGEIERPDDAD